jgi:hypothetical protein
MPPSAMDLHEEAVIQFSTGAPTKTETTPGENEHVCTEASCPENAGYYVSAIDAGQTHLMSGPYPTHSAALAAVKISLKIANEHDGRAWFMGWGTVKMGSEFYRPGSLNRAGLLKT